MENKKVHLCKYLITLVPNAQHLKGSDQKLQYFLWLVKF